MATTSGRGQSGLAFRAGYNPDAIMAMERNQARTAQNEAYQAQQQQKKRDQQTKEFRDKFKTDGLNFEGTKAAQLQANNYMKEYESALKNSSSGLLSDEQSSYFRNRREQVTQNIEKGVAYSKEIDSLHENILENEDLYNIPLVAEELGNYKQKMFGKDGSFNNEVALPKDIARKVNSAEYLNTSQVAKRFANTIESFKTTDIDGLEKREVLSKFAEWDQELNDWVRDANGEISVKVNGETVALARKDQYMNTILTDKVEKAKADGNEQYTYSDALREVLKGQQVADVKQINKSPSASSSSTPKYSDIILTEAPTVQYNPDFDTNGGVLGYRSQEALLNSMKIDNVNITSDDGSTKKTLYGDVQRMYTDNEGNPQLEIITTGQGDTRKPTPIPLNESTFKQLRGFADQEGKKVLDKLYAKIQDGGTKLYPSPKKTEELGLALETVLSKSSKTNTFGGDNRDSDEIKNQVVDILKQNGITIDPTKLSIEASNIGWSNNELTYNGKPYYIKQIDQLVNEIIKEHPNQFGVDKETYDRQMQSKPNPDPNPSPKNLSEEERLKNL